MLTLQALMYINGHGRTDGNHLERCHRYPDTRAFQGPITLSRARHNATPDCIIQLNCREKCTHASCKTTRTRESFNQPPGNKNGPPFRQTMINN